MGRSRAALACALALGTAALGPSGCAEGPRVAPRRPLDAAAPSAAPVPRPAASPAPSAEGPASPTSSTVPATRVGATRRYTVAAVGDSLTDGRSHGGLYLALLRERCPRSRFDDYGVGGEMVHQMRRRFARDVLGEPPDPDAPKPAYTDVIVQGGINDICSDRSANRRNRDVEADLAAMYRAAKARGIRVVALTLPPWGGFRRYYNARREASTHRLNDWIRAQAREGRVDQVVDVYPLLSCGEPTHLCERYGWPDQVHWNAEGHRIVGEALHRALFADCQ